MPFASQLLKLVLLEHNNKLGEFSELVELNFKRPIERSLAQAPEKERAQVARVEGALARRVRKRR